MFSKNIQNLNFQLVKKSFNVFIPSTATIPFVVYGQFLTTMTKRDNLEGKNVVF